MTGLLLTVLRAVFLIVGVCLTAYAIAEPGDQLWASMGGGGSLGIFCTLLPGPSR